MEPAIHEAAALVPVVLTQSTAADLERCKRRWWLRYYRRLGTPSEYRKPTNVGNLVHDALAAWYDGQSDPLEALKESALAKCEEVPDRADDVLKDAELAAIMIEGYLEKLEEEGWDAELEHIEPEKTAEVELTDGVTLRAKKDAKVRLRDAWTAFLEHKTVQNFVDLPANARQNRQLLTYELIDFLELLAEGKKKPRVAGGILNMLRKVKRTARANPPFYMREPVRHNVEQLRSHWKHMMAIAREIQEMTARLDAGEDHHTVAPPNPTVNCRWDCEYFAVCPMFDDGSDAEYVLAEEYVTVDPLARYGDPDKGGEDS